MLHVILNSARQFAWNYPYSNYWFFYSGPFEHFKQGKYWKLWKLCWCETPRARWSPLQSPGRSDHSRDDSLIADDASSTGNKDDDDDDDEDDANDENDGFSRDPERLKAFNVSNLVSNILIL